MKTGPDRKVVFILLALAAVCVIGLGAGLYRGKAAELARLRAELADKRNKLATLKKELDSQSDLEEKYERLQARLAVLEPGLPDAAYVPTFLRQIEGLAESTHNRIIMLKPNETAQNRGRSAAINDETGEVVGEDKAAASSSSSAKNADKAGEKNPKLPYDRADFELKIQGTYWTLIDFLTALQEFPKLIAVNDIAIDPDRASQARGGSSAQITATMALTAIITKEERKS